MSAHTTLDSVWIHEETEKKEYYGGLIRLAVSLYHLTSENPKEAVIHFEKARNVLKTFGDRYMGVLLSKLLKDLERLYQNNDLANLSDMDFRKCIPKIEFDVSSG